MRLDDVMEFFDALVRYEVGLWNLVDRELARQDQIGLGTLHALRVLDRLGGGARVQELSEEIGITVGAASKLVDRLERDGLATRRANPANRRSSLISLTELGVQALGSGLGVCVESVRSAVTGEDLRAVISMLDRLQARLGESTESVA